MKHKPGTPETNHEVRRHAPALSNEGPSVARKAGAGSEATGAPASWLKEPEHEAG